MRRETVSLCLNNGALECWLVDRKKQSITVIRKDGTSWIYEVTPKSRSPPSVPIPLASPNS